MVCGPENLWGRGATTMPSRALWDVSQGTYTHLFRASGEDGSAAMTVVLLALAALVGYVRRPETLRRPEGPHGSGRATAT